MFVVRRVGSMCSLCLAFVLIVLLVRSHPRRRVQRVRSDFCFKPDILKSVMSEEAEEERVTLVLHATFDRVGPKLIPQVNNWEGPISLAVVFPESIDDETTENRVACTAQKLKALRERHPNVALRLSVHFVIPRYTRICAEDRDLPETGTHCPEQSRVLTENEAIEAYVSYPINVARNLARKMVRSRYILIADLDHLFSENFESKMVGLAKKALAKDPKLVLVYRIFEVANDVKRLPRTKSDLKDLLDAKRAFVFHHEWRGHHIRALNEWLAAGEEDVPSIQFVQPYNVTDWEPQFVSLCQIPEHDESLFYPAADNTVLRWEMCRAGYKFAVVNDVFMFHLGVKSRNEQKLIDSARFRVKEETIAAKNAFLRRMNDEYPETRGKCGF